MPSRRDQENILYYRQDDDNAFTRREFISRFSPIDQEYLQNLVEGGRRDRYPIYTTLTDGANRTISAIIYGRDATTVFLARESDPTGTRFEYPIANLCERDHQFVTWLLPGGDEAAEEELLGTDQQRRELKWLNEELDRYHLRLDESLADFKLRQTSSQASAIEKDMDRFKQEIEKLSQRRKNLRKEMGYDD